MSRYTTTSDDDNGTRRAVHNRRTSVNRSTKEPQMQTIATLALFALVAAMTAAGLVD